MSDTKDVKRISMIVLAGFALSVLFHFSAAYFGYNYYPYNTFLFHPLDRFNDFLNIYHATHDLDPYAYQVSVYFPFTFMPMYLFTLVPEGLALLLFGGLFVTMVAWTVYKSVPSDRLWVKIYPIIVLCLLSYPMLFTLDRGNMEMLVFIFLALFLYYYKKQEDILSTIFLSMAIAMKLYPGVLVVLFFADKKYKNIIFSTLCVAILSVLSLLVLKVSVLTSLTGLQQNLSAFKSSYLVGATGLQHNASLYGMLRIGQLKFERIATILDIYSILAMAIFVLVSLYIVKVEKELWKRVALLLSMAILLPQVSFDYKLIHVLIIVCLYFQRKAPSLYDGPYAVLLGLLLIPKDYGWLFNDVSIAVLINPVLILMLSGLIIIEGLRPLLSHDPSVAVGRLSRG